jgi:cytosine/adenosine deaminase-related metal-dependent hydrolase
VTTRAAGRSGGPFTLRARWLVPLVGPPLENAWLVIDRGLVVAVGRGLPPHPPGEAIELGDAIVLPGLVNAHTHLEFSELAEPLAAAGGLPGWIGRVVAARRAKETGSAGDSEARAVTAIRHGLAESAAAGVTVIGEIATAAPPHAYAGPGPAVRVFREGLGLRAAAIDAVPRQIAADLDRLAAAGIACGISPHAPYSVAASLGRRLLAEAGRRRIHVAMHLLESEAEAELLARGTGPFRRLLEDLGAWDPGAPPSLLPAAEWIGRLARASRGIVVHATHIGHDEAALARLARHRDRLAVVVCPRTTRAISGALPPLAVLLAAGIRVALGTDSRASNPDLSVLAECRTLVDAGLASPEEALRMATIHGAWALGFDRGTGRIAPGRPADLAILRPATSQSRDPLVAALDPETVVAATLRRGRVIAGKSGTGADFAFGRRRTDE